MNFSGIEQHIVIAACGLIGAFMLIVSTPDDKFTISRIIVITIMAPILGNAAFILCGVWIDSTQIKYVIAGIAGFIGPPILRGITKITRQFGDNPAETTKTLLNIWKSRK